MREVFPELASVPVDFAWSGNVGFTLDRMPHAGRLDGLHYAMGYCGHGVAYSTWLGARIGDQLAGGAGSSRPDGHLPRHSALSRTSLVSAASWARTTDFGTG